MVLFNYALRELTAKIVYYGPGLSGKTTNLKYIHAELPEKSKGRMLSLATETDRTLYFDFLPVEAGVVRGIKTRVQLYTVPGQVFYNATRKLVLKGVDGIVFVADSQKSAMPANVQSWESLEENLAAHDVELHELPIVLQYNKRDLEDLHSLEEMNDILNKVNAPFYEAIAHNGIGVQDTLQAVSGLVLRKVIAKYGGDESSKLSLGMNESEESTTSLAEPLPFAKPAAQMPPVSEDDQAMQSLTAELDELIGGAVQSEDDVVAPIRSNAVAETALSSEVERIEDQPMGQPTRDLDPVVDELNLQGILDEALRSEDDPTPQHIQEPASDTFSFPDLLADAFGDDAEQPEEIVATVGENEAVPRLVSDGVESSTDSPQASALASSQWSQDVSLGAVAPKPPSVPRESGEVRTENKLAELSQTQMFVSEQHGKVSVTDAATTALNVEVPSKTKSERGPNSIEVPVHLELPPGEDAVELQIVLNIRLSRAKS